MNAGSHARAGRGYVGRLVVGCCVGALLAAPAHGQAQGEAGEHTVRPGDTLWGIAGRYLANPFLWPELHRANEHVRNPHLIFPDQRIRIPGLVVARDATGAGAGYAAGMGAPPERTVLFPDPTQAGGAGIRVEGAVEVARVQVLPGDVLRAGMLVPEATVAPIGTLAERASATIVGHALPPHIQLYERVFMPVHPAVALSPGDELHLMRAGRQVRPLGRIFESTGIARVVAVEGAVATVELIQQFDAVRLGDLALPLPAYGARPGVQPEPATGLVGSLVAFERPHPLQAPQELAFVDLGRASGVQPGDEFEVVLPPEPRSWGTRPVIPVARVQVVRVEESTAAVRVTHLEQPALRAGLPVRLVARMP